MPRKKKTNLLLLSEKVNDASKYTTKDLIDNLLEEKIGSEYTKCICILESKVKNNHKFTYRTAGYRDRFELLSRIEYVRDMILREMNEG